MKILLPLRVLLLLSACLVLGQSRIERVSATITGITDGVVDLKSRGSEWHLKMQSRVIDAAHLQNGQQVKAMWSGDRVTGIVVSRIGQNGFKGTGETVLHERVCSRGGCDCKSGKCHPDCDCGTQ